MSATDLLVLAMRIGAVALFLPFSALDKLLDFSGATSQALPITRSRTLAGVMIAAGLCVEIFASLALVTGIADRLGAFVLAGYCVATAALFKQFWVPGDFRSNRSGAARLLFWDFAKNIALGAALFAFCIGPDGRQLHAFLANPLASSHPYGHAR